MKPLAIFVLLPYVLAVTQPTFRDVTRSSGIRQQTWRKYGGPIVADLNNDGIYDLILTFHKNIPHEIFYGTAKGTFVSSGYKRGGDVHGVSVAPRMTNSTDKLVVLTLGGMGGNLARVPVVLQANENGITNIQNEDGFGRPAPRGRSTIFMDLALLPKDKKRERGGGPDLLWANFLGVDTVLSNGAPKQYAFENIGGQFVERQVPGFSKQRYGASAYTDIDGDGIMEVIMYNQFKIYKVVSPFTFRVVTGRVAPGLNVQDFSVTGVAEFDFDNDGDFDLYLARGYDFTPSTKSMKPDPRDQPDILLENRGGKYVDVSEKAGVTMMGRNMAATPGDFNNDGWVDLMVTAYDGPDLILLNNGDGTFTTINAGIPKPATSSGDNSLAVDYDEDGRVDIITGQGTVSGIREGDYRIMRNVMGSTGNYLHVHVGNEPSGACTALHAVVVVSGGGRKMIRRVGNGGGGQKQGGGSFLDTVHFGCGTVSRVDVEVRWACGGTRKASAVAVNQKIKVGEFVVPSEQPGSR